METQTAKKFKFLIYSIQYVMSSLELNDYEVEIHIFR